MSIRRLKLIVTNEGSGQRLDQWLTTPLEQEFKKPISRGAIRKQILAGSIYLNSKQVRIASKTLIPGARIEIFWNTDLESEAGAPRAQSFEVETLFEDEWIWVVNKPAGLPSQPTLDPNRPSLYTELQKRAPYIGLHHRLDRDTSGVILFTKKKEANFGVAALFRDHQIQKTYQALVAQERKTAWPEGVWTTTSYLKPKHLSGKKKQMVPVTAGGDFAETVFEVLESFEAAALIQAEPKTGRMHQIRAHALQNGFPLLGNALYHGQMEWKGQAVPRFFLHARELRFKHPISDQPMHVTAPVPEEFQQWHIKLKNA